MSVGCGEESVFRRNRGSTQDVKVNISGVFRTQVASMDMSNSDEFVVASESTVEQLNRKW